MNRDWLFEGTIDFEYKKYILLAYMKKVDENFSKRKLYPSYYELKDLLKDLIVYKESFTDMNKRNRVLTGFDFNLKKLIYKDVKDSRDMEELKVIVDYSISVFEDKLKHARQLYKEIYSDIKFQQIGINPEKLSYGFVFIKNNSKEIDVYRYMDLKIGHVYTSEIITLEKIGSEKMSYDELKVKYINLDNNFFMPAFYSLECEKELPVEEAIIPVCKKKLAKLIRSSS